MLSKEYSNLIKQNSEILGFATLLDPEAFQKLLQPIVPVEDVQLKQIRFKPRRNCIATYEIKISGVRTNIYAKAYAPYGKNKIRNALERMPRTAINLPQKIVLEEEAIVLFFFPADDKLKSLNHLTEPGKQIDLMRELFPDQPDWWEGSLHTLQYRAEQRYVVRLDTQKGPQAVLKFYTPQTFSKTLTAANAFKSQGILRVPQCLGFSKARNCLAFEWLPGQRLRKIVSGDLDEAIQSVWNTGVALGTLHGQKVAGLADQKKGSIIDSLTVKAYKLNSLCPSLKVKIDRLAAQLTARLAGEPPIRCPIHGDFHLNQVLVDNNELDIIDFDDSVLGDPRQDLGRFIASLHRRALRGKISVRRLELLVDAFLSGYRQSSEKPVPAGLEVYATAALFKPPYLHSSTLQSGKINCSGLIHATLDKAEAILQKTEDFLHTA